MSSVVLAACRDQETYETTLCKHSTSWLPVCVCMYVRTYYRFMYVYPNTYPYNMCSIIVLYICIRTYIEYLYYNTFVCLVYSL